MKDFEYLEPASLEETSTLLAQYQEEAKLMAGGVSLLAMMKNRIINPTYLINLKSVPNLSGIAADGNGGLRIGALAHYYQIASSTLVLGHSPILAEAAGKIGSVAIRNMGTIGGNICHADPAADLPGPLIALNAKAKVRGSQGERILAIEELFQDYYQTALRPDEVMEEIHLPPSPPHSGGAFIKLNRTATDMAVVGIAVMLTLKGNSDHCLDARIALGAVGPTPIRAKGAEELLRGKRLQASLLKEAGNRAAQESQPISDVKGSAEYKREVVKVLVRRALEQAQQRAKANGG